MSQDSERSDRDLEDGLGDWRFHAVTRLAIDLPDRGPGKRAKRAGAFVGVTRSMRAQNGDEFSFTDFSSIALALSVAIASDRRAQELRPNVEPVEVQTETGIYRTIKHENIGAFFDFIEQCMVAATFSFQALEAFCNFTIQDKLGDTGEYTFTQEICRQMPGTRLNAGDLDKKKCSTEDKLSVIVPDLINVATPKGKTPWLGYKRLQGIRNSILHMKHEDQRGAAMWPNYIDDASVFAQLVDGEISDLPWIAVALLDYFTKPNGTPRWLLYPLSFYGIASTKQKPIGGRPSTVSSS